MMFWPLCRSPHTNAESCISQRCCAPLTSGLYHYIAKCLALKYNWNMVNWKSTPSKKYDLDGQMFSVKVCVCLCLYQGLHEQPGVESQRFLSAQCRHQLLQPITDRVKHLKIAGKQDASVTVALQEMMKDHVTVKQRFTSKHNKRLHECWSFSS